MSLTFITGPVRSGKSRLAELLAVESHGRVSYLATAARDATDYEWNARLDRHARERPAEWATIETAALSHEALIAIFVHATDAQTLLVDSLGTWLSTRLSDESERLIREYGDVERNLDECARELAIAMRDSRANVIVVCEQVGWDVVPIAASARIFRDVLGRAGQHLATWADHALLVVAGYAVDLKITGRHI